MTIVLAAHQPDPFPFIRFFAKMQLATVFDLAIHDQMTRSSTYTRHRVKIGTDDHNEWWTLPVKWNHGDPIGSVQLNRAYLLERYEHLYRVYGSYPRWKECKDELYRLVVKPHSDLMWVMNRGIMAWMQDQLRISTPMRWQLDPPLGTTVLERLADVLQAYEARVYITGNGEYLVGHEDEFRQWFRTRGFRPPTLQYFRSWAPPNFRTVSALGIILSGMSLPLRWAEVSSTPTTDDPWLS